MSNINILRHNRRRFFIEIDGHVELRFELTQDNSLEIHHFNKKNINKLIIYSKN